MKSNIKYFAQAGIVALAATITCGSCTDTWDEHYAVNNNVPNVSLWECLNKNSELKPFVDVLQACDYDKVLQSEQVFTVWAPKITSEKATELINRYNNEKNRNIKDEDNSVIKQFIRNHVALYSYPMSTLSNDTVMMMNGKRMIVTKDKFNNNVDIVPGSETPTRNGILYTLNGEEEYFPNIYESIQRDSVGDNGLDSLYSFLSSYDQYYFDASASVPGGVVDGQIIYLDSVTYSYNTLLNSYGRINDEDSLFWVLAPTNKVWREKVAEYEKYFQYHQTQVAKEDRDSLQFYYARQGLINDIFFNARYQPGEISDSICSTRYSQYNPGYGVFYKPFEADGILNGLAEPVTASNGKLYKSNDWKILPFDRPIEVEAEGSSYYEVKPADETTVLTSVERLQNGSKFNLSNSGYLRVTSTRNSKAPSILINIPNVLSQFPYNIKVIFATPLASDSLSTDTLPRKIKVGIKSYNTLTATQISATAKVLMNNVEIDPMKMDTLLVTPDEGWINAVCSYGESETKRVQLEITSTATSSTIDKTYSKNLCIDKIIFEPRYATKEETEN